MAPQYTADFLGREIIGPREFHITPTDFLGRDVIGIGQGSTDFLGRLLLAPGPS